MNAIHVCGVGNPCRIVGSGSGSYTYTMCAETIRQTISKPIVCIRESVCLLRGHRTNGSVTGDYCMTESNAECVMTEREHTFQWAPGEPYTVTLFYKYFPLLDPQGMHDTLLTEITAQGLLGRILISKEGLNGTLAGSRLGIDRFVDAMCRTDEIFKTIDWKLSTGQGDSLPFQDVHLKVVNQIISVGDANSIISECTSFDTNSFGGLCGTGTHLTPLEWENALKSDTQKIVLDVRNELEYNIGHFDSAVGLSTKTYAETWNRMNHILDTSDCRDVETNIYMYCTGGIRCEKASAYVKSLGYKNVFQV